MAKGFAIHNAPTDHGGIVPATQMRSSQMGNLFVCVGDGHFCPKCKCWSTVVKSHDHVLFDGKSVVYAGDLLTCGARILPQQSHVVGTSGSSNSSNKVSPISNSHTQSFTNNLISKNIQDKNTNFEDYKMNALPSYPSCDEDGNCVQVEEKPIKQFTLLEELFIAPIRVLTGGVRKIGINKKPPVYPNDKAAGKAAEAMGYKKTNYRTRNGAAVYKKGNSYISRDVDGHNGGAWKEASSVDKLNSKSTRNGTYDINMNRIGD